MTEKQGERFYVIAVGAELVDLTKSFGSLEEATFAAQRGQMAQETKFVVLGIRFCATIITAAAPGALEGGRRRRGSARIFHDPLPGSAVYETQQLPHRVPQRALEGDVEEFGEFTEPMSQKLVALTDFANALNRGEIPDGRP